MRSHPKWQSYFHPNSLEGILQSICGRAEKENAQANLDALFATLSKAELAVLKTIICSKLDTKISPKSQQLIRLLPILHTNHNGSSRLTQFSSALHIPPKMFTELRIFDYVTRGPFLQCHSEDYKLADAMGFSRLTDVAFLDMLTQSILGPSVPHEKRDEITIYILSNLNSTSFTKHQQHIAQYRLIPTANGELRRPRELFHPTSCCQAPELLQDPHCFPSKQFCSPVALQALTALGMHTSFSPELLESVVDKIAAAPTSNASFTRATKLLELLSADKGGYCSERYKSLFAKMKAQPCILVQNCPAEYP
jgi:hypothetical protein